MTLTTIACNRCSARSHTRDDRDMPAEWSGFIGGKVHLCPRCFPEYVTAAKNRPTLSVSAWLLEVAGNVLVDDNLTTPTQG